MGRRRLTPFRLDLLEDSLDPVLALDALVEEELQLRNAPEPQPAAELPPEERRRTLERALRLAPGPLVAHRGVVDARLLEVGRHLDVGDGQEADSRILHVACEQLGNLDANLVADADRTGIGHASHGE